MIARLQGQVAGRDADSLVVDVGGVGFRVLVPAPLLASLRVGDMVSLFTNLQVRENGLVLFGCSGPEEMALFQQLISVSGVGPKLALALLSTISPDALRLAIGQGQAEVLTRVPGIGKRSAERIIFHLKDSMPVGDLPEAVSELSLADTEVVEALIALGYSVVEAQRAVQGLPPEVTEVEDRLRMALGRFGRP